MVTLNEELDIDLYTKGIEPLGDGRYCPNRDLRFYPGANLPEERRHALDAQAVDSVDLTVDDITYCLSKLVTTTMYELVSQVEARWGKEAAQEVVFEWARRRANRAISAWAGVRGITRVTAETWAQYQDLRHAMSGPIHAHSFISYLEKEGDEDVLQLDRTGCFFHTGRPDGMDSYSPFVSRGMALGYREAFPELTLEIVRCRGEGTSAAGCTLQFRIKTAGPGDSNGAGGETETLVAPPHRLGLPSED